PCACGATTWGRRSRRRPMTSTGSCVPQLPQRPHPGVDPMTGSVIRRLGDVRMADVPEVGGKAANLGELFAAGVRVPDGVVLTARAAGLTTFDRRSLVDAGAGHLGSGPFAVRSSGISEDGAQHSYAGMFETVLDVARDDLPAAIDRVLDSARGPRALEYKSAGGQMAVIVQRMIEPVAAGVALTADPISGDRGSTVVTAVRGIGDRLLPRPGVGGGWVGGGGAG